MEDFNEAQSENTTPDEPLEETPDVDKKTSGVEERGNLVTSKPRKPLYIAFIVVVVLALLIVVGITSKESGDLPLGDNSEDAIENRDTVGKEDTSLPPQINSASILSAYKGRPLGEVRFGEGPGMPEEVIGLQAQNLKDLVAVIEENPENAEAWIGVGTVKKFFNDYEGARDVWSYAAAIFPSNPTVHANLANLYGFYLGDNENAVLNYERAIENIPFEANYYLALADFYKEVDKDNQQKAVEVILEGLENVPNDLNLLLFLATFYRDTGDSEGAIEYYNKVLEVSPDHPGIAEEIERLEN